MMIAPTSKPKMETGFEPGDSANLPRMDCFMVAAYLVTLPKHDLSGKTSKSSEECYGDDAIGYVQLRRDASLCTLKARVCPKPQAYANVTLTLNEIEDEVVNIQCHGCERDSGCMHGAAFLLWLHRRSEEPDFRHRECYWRKPWMAEPVKFITTKELSKTKRLPKSTRTADPAVLNEFLAEAKKRNLDGPLIRFFRLEFRCNSPEFGCVPGWLMVMDDDDRWWGAPLPKPTGKRDIFQLKNRIVIERLLPATLPVISKEVIKLIGRKNAI